MALRQRYVFIDIYLMILRHLNIACRQIARCLCDDALLCVGYGSLQVDNRFALSHDPNLRCDNVALPRTRQIVDAQIDSWIKNV